MAKSHNVPTECVTVEELQNLHDGKPGENEIKAIVAKINSCALCKRKWMLFKPRGSKSEIPEQGTDFIKRLKEEIDRRIERVAERLLEINMFNGQVVRQVTDDIFKDCPRPDDLSARIYTKLQELHRNKATSC